MKAKAIQKLRAKLKDGQPVYGLWATLESASVSEMAVSLDLDWVVVDAEHGHLDWRDILEHIRATVRSDTVVLVRIAELNIGLIKRVLDIGADGVVVPWVESAEQLRQAVAYAHYPPDGHRGMGGERATAWGQNLIAHIEEAEENVLIVPIIESVRGADNIEALLEVDGVDIYFFGPADFSASAGHPGQWEGPGVAEKILRTHKAIGRLGRYSGVMIRDEDDLHRRLQEGFGMLGLGTDTGLLLRGLRAVLRAVDRDRQLPVSLDPKDAQPRKED